MIKTTLAAWFIASEKDWPEFGCIAENGRWNKPKLKKLLEDAYYDGYSTIRVLPYLLGDPQHNGRFELNQHNFLPFLYDGVKFDLSRLNQIWLDNLSELVTMCNSYSLKLRLSTFDDCHGKAAIGPWRNNVQGITTWRGMGTHVQRYLDAIGGALRGSVYTTEIENEPTERDFHGSMNFPSFCKLAMRHLDRAGINWDSVGGEFMYPGPRSYKEFIDTLGADYRINKLSTLHEFGPMQWGFIWPRFQRDVVTNQDGRKLCLSSDGLKPRRNENMEYDFWFPRFQLMPALALMDSEIEICPHSYPGDPNGFDVCRHAGRGVLMAAGIPLPQRPEPVKPDPPIPPPDPIPPKPIPEEEKLQYTRLFSGFKKKFPWVDMRLWGWIVQNWNQKTIRHISFDAMMVLTAGYGLYRLITWIF